MGTARHREERQPQVPAKEEGAHYWELFPGAWHRGGMQVGGGHAELLRFPGAEPFTSAERGAVCVITRGRAIQVMSFLSLTSSGHEIAKSSRFLGSLFFAGKVKGVKVGTSRDQLFFHTFSESSVT